MAPFITEHLQVLTGWGVLACINLWCCTSVCSLMWLLLQCSLCFLYELLLHLFCFSVRIQLCSSDMHGGGLTHHKVIIQATCLVASWAGLAPSAPLTTSQAVPKLWVGQPCYHFTKASPHPNGPGLKLDIPSHLLSAQLLWLVVTEQVTLPDSSHLIQE